MNTTGADYIKLGSAAEVERATKAKKVPKAKRATKGIKHLFEKIADLPSIMNADAIFKSKDWPHF